MYCHIFLGISIISFCLGENSNMAKSAVSFHQDSASLSYTYSYNNIHPSSLKPHGNQTRPKFYKKLQYAPLVSNHIKKHKNDRTKTKAVAYQRSDIKNVTKYEYLEPQVYGSANGYENRQFISGYNIDVPKHNNFGYNMIDLEHKNVATENKMNNFQKNTKNITPKKQDLSQDHVDNLMVFKSIKHQKFPSKSTLEILSMLENPQIHPAFNPYVKVPKLHLNVARRAFNFGQNPMQAPLIEHKKWQQNNYEHGQRSYNDKQALLKAILYPMN